MMTNKKGFPINYLVSMSSLQRIFDERSCFHWWKLAFLLLFINGCLMMPIALHLSTVKSVPLSLIAPTIDKTINTKFVSQIRGISIENGTLSAMSSHEQKSGNRLLAIDPSNTLKINGSGFHQSVKDFESVLVFQRHRLVISDENGFGFTLTYPKNESIMLTNDKSDLKVLVSQLWIRQYKPVYLAAAMLLCFIGLMFSNMILMGVMAFILWLTKHSKISDIHSFREAVAIVVMSAGWPSITALIFSLFSFDFGSMIMIQSIGLVLMISLVFWKTRFQNVRQKIVDA